MRHHVRMMEATDMRSLSREARHERRVQVIRLRSDLVVREARPAATVCTPADGAGH
jgi:hypothetical protein